MANIPSTAELTVLSVDQRLQLIEELWDSLHGEFDKLPLSDWQRETIDQRLAALESGASVGSPWQDVRQRITGAS